MNEEFEEIEDWLGWVLEESATQRTRSRATQGLELLDEAYGLPWWRLLARRRLVREADRVWR